MRSVVLILGGALTFGTCGTSILDAQQSRDQPSFDVASIKPAPDLMAQIASGKPPHLGMQVDGARVDIGALSLTELIGMAYDLNTYQIVGPAWMSKERFDIQASLPSGSPKNQVPAMLQTLLVERFKLAAHRDHMDHDFYVMVAGKSGARLKPSAEGADASPTAADSREIKGQIRAAPGPDGMIHVENDRMTMKQLAGFLSTFVNRPVTDLTGLVGNYQVVLTLPISALEHLNAAAGFAAPRLGADWANSPADLASDPSGEGAVLRSVQTLGLKLEPRKMPIEVIVIDRLEKAPSDN